MARLSVHKLNPVILCAEEDDLDLVELVHLGYQRGISFEVVPGVESSDAPLLETLDRVHRGLFILLRSENLDAERVLQVKARFEEHRGYNQHLLALRFDQSRAKEILAVVERRIEQIAQSSMIQAAALAAPLSLGS